MKSVNQTNALRGSQFSVQDLPWAAISGPLVAAEDELARLDERLRGSPVREGWIARADFRDVVACAWVSGQLVSLEDLVLRDNGMDVRAPSAALTQAQEVLSVRRRIASGAGGSVLSVDVLEILRGRRAVPLPETVGVGAQDAIKRDDSLSLLVADVEDAIGRSQRALGQLASAQEIERDPLVYDLDWNEEERLAKWRASLGGYTSLPPVLACALAASAWDRIEPLQHQRWFGRFLASALLRERGKVRTHLPCLYVGQRAAGRGRRRSGTVQDVLIAEFNAIAATAREGLREHDRLMLARTQFQQRLKDRRSTSHLPELIDFVLSTPLVSTGLVAKRLKISQRAARDLITALGPREMTGRERYRAWGVI